MLTAALLFVISAIPAWSMTVTFVRHAESQANADHIIETDIPGRGLTEQGHAEAAAAAAVLAGQDFDAIYSSPLQRTMETAQALAALTGQDISQLTSLREIPGGWLEGARDDRGIQRLLYGLPAMAWTLGLRFVPVLGSEDGNAFDARVDGALRQMYEDGVENPVVFSHGATIMFWTLMNVDNPDLGLMLSHTLGNTDTVVVEGSPEEGWTLVSWAGVEVSANPPLLTKLLVHTRDLIVAPQTALYNIGRAFASGDIAALANAVRDGVIDVVKTAVEFVPNVIRDVVDEFRGPSAQTVDEPVNINAADVSSLDAEADAPTIEPETTPVETTADADAAPLLTKVKKRAGATDLTDGNKVNPGDTVEAVDVDVDEDAEADAEVDAEPRDLKGLVTAITDRFGGTMAPGKSDADVDSTDTDTDSDSDTDADAGSAQVAA
ncbi:histidine phosphatase family protein [Mycolicibacterium sp. XJ647]